jgi:hypothetical protein
MFVGPRIDGLFVLCGGSRYDESFTFLSCILSLVLNHSLSTSPTQHTTTIMADLLTSYNALSPSSPTADVSKVLNAIMSGVWPHVFLSCPITPALTSALKAHFVDNATREALVSALLSDIGSCKPGSTTGRLHHTGKQLVSRLLSPLKVPFHRCSARSFNHQGSGSPSVRVVRRSVGK